MADPTETQERLVEELLRLYQRTETELRRVLGSADSTDFMRGRASRLLIQVQAVIRRLKDRHRRWAPRAVTSAYRVGAEAFDQPPVFDLIDRRAVQVLVERMVLDLDRAADGIPRELGTIFRRTQQEATTDVALLERTAQARAEGLTREELARRIAQTLRDGATERLRGRLPGELAERLRAIAEGHYVPIVGKDGKLRRYSLQAYANLVGRTWTMAATNEATVHFAERYGMDLVRVSVHSHVPDELCLSQQGKVFSLAGRHPDFPPLTLRPPYHPNCRHRLTAVNEDTLRENGQYDALVAFSRSEATVSNLLEYRQMLRGE